MEWPSLAANQKIAKLTVYRTSYHCCVCEPGRLPLLFELRLVGPPLHQCDKVQVTAPKQMVATVPEFGLDKSDKRRPSCNCNMCNNMQHEVLMSTCD